MLAIGDFNSFGGFLGHPVYLTFSFQKQQKILFPRGHEYLMSLRSYFLSSELCFAVGL